jgi:hypothetical protein
MNKNIRFKVFKAKLGLIYKLKFAKIFGQNGFIKWTPEPHPSSDRGPEICLISSGLQLNHSGKSAGK